MNLAHMSDSDLQKIASGIGGGLAHLSDDDLQKIAGGGDSDNIVEEMHPDLSTVNRLLVKNFSNSPEASLQYLQKQHPNLQIKLGGDDGKRIIAKRPEEKSWRPLDPDAGILETLKKDPAEVLRDLGDVGADVVSGLGAGAATAAGGLAGNIPGAMAAGGAASAGLEAGRQGIGKLLGINKDMDGGDIAVSGGLGAIAPLIFGSGAGAKAIGKAAIAKAGEDATAGELLQTSKGMAEGQRGLLGRLRDAFLPKLAESTSGVPADVIKTMAERLPELQMLEKEGVTDFAEGKHQQLRETLHDWRSQVGDQLGQKIDAAGGKIPLAEVRKPLEDFLAKLEAQKGDLNNPAMEKKIAEVKTNLQELFSKPGTPAVPGSPATANAMDPATGLMKYGSEATPAIAAGAPQQVDNISARAAMTLKNDLGDLANLAKSTPGLQGRMAGATSFEKELANVAGKSNEKLGKAIQDAVQGLGPLSKEYAEASRVQKQLSPFFTDPTRSFNTLRTLGGKNKTIVYEALGKVDAQLGTDMVDSAKLIQAHSAFSNAPLDPVSGLGASSTARTGLSALVGAAAGHSLGKEIGGHDNPNAGYIGGALGAFAGGRAGGPKAIRAAVQAYQSKIGQAAKGAMSGNLAPQSTWNFVARGGAGQ